MEGYGQMEVEFISISKSFSPIITIITDSPYITAKINKFFNQKVQLKINEQLHLISN